MIGQSTFNPKLYSQLKIITSIQKDLSKVNDGNIDEIAILILNQKEVVGSQGGVLVLAQSFNDMADFLPRKIELLADLFIFLQKSKSTTNYLHLLKDYIVLCLHTRERLRVSQFYFLRVLLIKKAITIDSIINEISMMKPFTFNEHKNKISQSEDTSNNEEQKTLKVDDENIYFKEKKTNKNFSQSNLFQSNFNESLLISKKFNAINWFYPEIKAVNQQFIQKVMGDLHYQIPPEFKDSQLDEVTKLMNVGYSTDFLAKIIRDDDIDSFLQIVSKLGTNFNVNQTIKSSKFERCSLLSYDPTLIQYSAFFNSIKVFKYLYLNKADLQIKNNKIHSLLHFAIAGGSFEIIHILEQNDFDFNDAIPIAIKFFQNDIFSWILENHPPNSEHDFACMNYYYTIDFKRWNYFWYSNRIIDLENGECFENDIYHPPFYYYCKESFRYVDISDDDNDDDDDKEEEENLFNDKEDSYFKYFDFDFIFRTIIETNNYLALFLLFDHGMNINSRNKSSKKTLLHFAIQKGKSFLVKLLISNKLIDFTLKDESGQVPIIYSVKYMREKIFFTMIKEKKILDSLTSQDYILMLNYAEFCDLPNIKNYLSDIWKCDLLSMMETDDIKSFCNSMNLLSISLFYDQIESFLADSFKSRKYDYFCIFANRLLNEKSLNLNGKFYFVPSKMKKDLAKEFREFCYLLAYYSRGFSYNSINYYENYRRNLDGKAALSVSRRNFGDNFKENEYFIMRSNNNVIAVYNLKDSKETQYSEINLNHGDDNEKKIKKKKSNNNKPMICVDDDCF